MTTTVVVGAQWGDEGKGKVVDVLAPEMDFIVRYHGGSNAGHTVLRNGQEFKFHLLPSGCLRPEKISVIAPGMVLDLPLLLEEIEALESFGVEKPNLRISPKVHLVMPYHKRLDELEEARRGERAVGTTKRGIGPAYADRAARTGIRLSDLFHPDEFREKLAFNLAEKNVLFQHLYGENPMPVEPMVEEYLRMREAIEPYMADTGHLLQQALRENKNILFEGAQGTLLDLEYGTYPYVTSSHTISAAVGLSTGVGLRQIDRIIGVSKAYATRVGGGPFPTELVGGLGDHIRSAGKEYGATTGRPRRCGWLDLVLLRYAARVNDLTSLAITKLDVLRGLEKIQVAVAYRYQGRITQDPPEDLGRLSECEPIYESFPGWSEVPKTEQWEEAPEPIQKYIDFVQREVAITVDILSYSPAPADTLRNSRLKA